MTGMYDKNLALFRELGPDLHRVLASRGKSQKNLIQVGDDDWDVEIDGKRFYGMGARDHANRQVKEFWEKQVNRLTLTPPNFKTSNRGHKIFLSRCLNGPSTTTSPYMRTGAISGAAI